MRGQIGAWRSGRESLSTSLGVEPLFSFSYEVHRADQCSTIDPDLDRVSIQDATDRASAQCLR